MWEVDQALARAFAQRGATEQAAMPSPRPSVARGFDRAAAPHFAIEPGSSAADPPVVLQWPATIRVLERAFGDRFERMADALIAARDQRRLKVVLFTSCHRAEGRTSLVLTLARALARRPGRTVLVDADLTGPMLARQLGLRPAVGLDDVIEDGLALADALIDAADDHLAILPLRAPVARPREFLASPGWACALARLRREFDLALLDGSPLFSGLSAAVLHRAVDAAILVHNRALTGERALLRAREVLDAGGIPLLGLAETFVEEGFTPTAQRTRRKHEERD
jgi:Mrp family chromosome partitioning ATPase